MSMFYDFGGGVANVNLDKWLAPKYDENLTWKPGDYCVYLGVLKKCTATTTGPFVEASWKDAFLINDGGGGGGSDSFDFIAKEYDPDETYNAGDVVLYNDETQECTADGTTGSWDSSKWKRVYLADLNSNLSGKADLLWTNPNPTSAFAAQTVSVDLSNYIGVIIEWDVNAKGYIEKTDTTNNFGMGSISMGEANSRGVVSINDDGITFTDGYVAAHVNNNAWKPQKIYGVNWSI